MRTRSGRWADGRQALALAVVWSWALLGPVVVALELGGRLSAWWRGRGAAEDLAGISTHNHGERDK